MTDSGIWWRRLEAPLKALALSPLLALGGCGLDQLLFSRPPAEPPPEPLPPTRGNASQVDVGAGLAPLPSSQQVLSAVPFGRIDPFAAYPTASLAPPGAPAAGPAGTQAAPIQAAAAAARNASGAATTAGGTASGGRAPVPVPPPGFVLNGVMRTGGRAAALVTFGGATGTLRPGDQGGRSTDLLPPGWSLAAIQFGGRTPSDPPAVILRSAGRQVKVSLL